MPEKRDIINGKESSDPFRGERTKVFLPSRQFPRIQVQKGAFTVFKYISNQPKHFMPLERNPLLRRKLQRIRFPFYRRNDLIKSLDGKNINRSSMFPELDELGKRLMEKYTK